MRLNLRLSSGSFLAALGVSTSFLACAVAEGTHSRAEARYCDTPGLLDGVNITHPPKRARIAIADRHGNEENVSLLRCILDNLEGRTLIAYELPAAGLCRFDDRGSDCGGPWHSAQQDGRTSKAAYSFLQVAVTDADIDILFFDPALTHLSSAPQEVLIEARERISSEAILDAFDPALHDNLILFSGSIRAGRDPYSVLQSLPISTLLMRLEEALGERFSSFALANRLSSEAWQCRAQCGPQPVTPNKDFLAMQVEAGIYDHLVVVDTLTISAPQFEVTDGR
jgi:hypothetical protein